MQVFIFTFFSEKRDFIKIKQQPKDKRTAKVQTTFEPIEQTLDTNQQQQS